MASRQWLRHNAVVILTAALAIGSLIAVFDVLNSELLTPLPYPNPSSLVAIRENVHAFRSMSVALSDVRAWSSADIFAAVGAYRTMHYTLAGAGPTVEVTSPAVTTSIFPLLGAKMFLGRYFDAAENRAGGRPAAILSYRFWQAHFAANPGAIGAIVRLDGQPFTVVGVAERGFAFPRNSELWTSLAAFPASTMSRNVGFTALARLRRGQTLAGAYSALNAEFERRAAAHLDPRGETAAIVPYLRYVAGGAGATLYAAFVAAALVLLVACLNIAMLLLARGETRRAEFAIRSALGASARRLRWPVLREALGLAVGGAVIGSALAWLAIRLAGAMLVAELPRPLAPWLDWRLAACIFLTVLITAAVSGWWPSRRAKQSAPADALRAAGGGRPRLASIPQGWLAAAEIALTLPLAVAACLLLLSLRTLLQVNPGFRPAGVLVFQIASGPGSGASRPAGIRALERAFAALPGVRQVGTVVPPPLSGNLEIRFLPLGVRRPPGIAPLAMVRILDPGAFRALGVTILRGRAFTPLDTKKSPVVIVGRRLAARYWPHQNPVGKRLWVAGNAAVIVGVARHIAVNSLTEKSELDQLPQILIPAAVLAISPDFVLRSAPGLEPATLVPAAAAVARAQSPGSSLADVQTLSSLVAAALGPRRLATTLAAAYAVLALCLAGLGIFAVLANEVASRAGEIGIRMALGAAPATVAAMIARRAFCIAAVGGAVGLGFALAAGRALSAFLYRTPPLSVAALAIAWAAVLTVALAATTITALRAARLDPSQCLRAE